MKIKFSFINFQGNLNINYFIVVAINKMKYLKFKPMIIINKEDYLFIISSLKSFALN